ncbi:uncharacterized protein [Rutidosis leptorrhynchoides]|uniref:uncharacterized protein n=1 Tax=Rutidosis leptorrhynchoides TaxID=125765 RepID=UPI003A99F330
MATEFNNQKMEDLCNKEGFQQQFSSPYTPQMNEVAEKKNRTLIETAGTMLADSELPVIFWSKVNPKAVTGRLMGYVNACKRVFNLDSRCVKEQTAIDIQRHAPIPAGKGFQWQFDYDELFDSFHLSEENSNDEIAAQMMYNMCISSENASDVRVQSGIPIKTETSTHEFGPNNGESDFDASIPQLEHTLCLCLIQPRGYKPCGLKWILKNKKDDQGIVIRNKARLVVTGYQQIPDIDYDKMHVKSAFLYGTLQEIVYVTQPPGFTDLHHPEKVFLLEKELYVLHQAPRACKKDRVFLKWTPSLGLWYPHNDGFELTTYSDYDYGGCKRDFKSTSGGCQFLGSRLVSWQCKKQTAVAQLTC